MEINFFSEIWVLLNEDENPHQTPQLLLQRKQPSSLHTASIRGSHLRVEVPACDPSWFRVCPVVLKAEVMLMLMRPRRDALISTLCVWMVEPLYISEWRARKGEARPFAVNPLHARNINARAEFSPASEPAESPSASQTKSLWSERSI